jgi:hypothetical protein
MGQLRKGQLVSCQLRWPHDSPRRAINGWPDGRRPGLERAPGPARIPGLARISGHSARAQPRKPVAGWPSLTSGSPERRPDEYSSQAASRPGPARAVPQTRLAIMVATVLVRTPSPMRGPPGSRAPTTVPSTSGWRHQKCRHARRRKDPAPPGEPSSRRTDRAQRRAHTGLLSASGRHASRRFPGEQGPCRSAQTQQLRGALTSQRRPTRGNRRRSGFPMPGCHHAAESPPHRADRRVVRRVAAGRPRTVLPRVVVSRRGHPPPVRPLSARSGAGVAGTRRYSFDRELLTQEGTSSCRQRSRHGSPTICG